MILFPTGIGITDVEHKGLLHLETDPEAWLRETISEKARARREALIKAWRPRLFADPAVAEVPADADALVQLIMARAGYRTRLQSDAERIPPELPYRHNIDRFNGNIRRGVPRDPAAATIVLFAEGIDLPDSECGCILAYVQDLDDWVLGALLGHINRGKKKIIAQYEQVLRDDPNVAAIPATEDGLIEVLTGRSEYETIPQQILRINSGT
jgi:hypothetical protein